MKKNKIISYIVVTCIIQAVIYILSGCFDQDSNDLFTKISTPLVVIAAGPAAWYLLYRLFSGKWWHILSSIAITTIMVGYAMHINTDPNLLLPPRFFLDSFMVLSGLSLFAIECWAGVHSTK